MLLDRQPVLRSDLLLVRPLAGEDFEPLRQIAADPAVWEQHPAKDRTREPVFRAWFADALASGGALVALDRREGVVIGTSRYVQRGEDAVEVGWTFLSPSRWGGVWNGELKRLMLAHAFASVTTVVFVVHPANTRSLRAVERLGAVRGAPSADGPDRGGDVVLHLRRAADPAGDPVRDGRTGLSDDGRAAPRPARDPRRDHR